MLNSRNRLLTESEFQSLTQRQKNLVRRTETVLLERQVTQPPPSVPESLMAFVPWRTPRWERPEHLKPAVEVLERALKEPVRAIITVPPQHGKTETNLHHIVWYLCHFPERTAAFISYAQDYSESKAARAQVMARASGLNADPRRQNLSEWRTLEGGGILATGIGGPLTGQAVHLAHIDDPVKNREEADSPSLREKHWNWFEDVLETRLHRESSVILTMTRWHEDDLAGRIIKNRPGEYEIIRLPAISDGMDAFGLTEAPSLDGRNVGEALWPHRKNLAELEEIREKKPFTFTSMYQGLPRSREDRVFSAPHYYRALPPFVQRSGGLDLAYTRTTRADHTAIVIMLRQGEYRYVVFAARWRAEISESMLKLETYQQRFGVKFRVEDNGPQKAVNDTLESRNIRIERFQPVGDKLARATEYADAWNSGRVLLPDPSVFPEHREWLEWFIPEHESFTGVGDASDDGVDAGANAYNAKALVIEESPRKVVTDGKYVPKRAGGY